MTVYEHLEFYASMKSNQSKAQIQEDVQRYLSYKHFHHIIWLIKVHWFDETNCTSGSLVTSWAIRSSTYIPQSILWLWSNSPSNSLIGYHVMICCIHIYVHGYIMLHGQTHTWVHYVIIWTNQCELYILLKGIMYVQCCVQFWIFFLSMYIFPREHEHAIRHIFPIK